MKRPVLWTVNLVFFQFFLIGCSGFESSVEPLSKLQTVTSVDITYKSVSGMTSLNLTNTQLNIIDFYDTGSYSIQVKINTDRGNECEIIKGIESIVERSICTSLINSTIELKSSIAGDVKIRILNPKHSFVGKGSQEVIKEYSLKFSKISDYWEVQFNGVTGRSQNEELIIKEITPQADSSIQLEISSFNTGTAKNISCSAEWSDGTTEACQVNSTNSLSFIAGRTSLLVQAKDIDNSGEIRQIKFLIKSALASEQCSYQGDLFNIGQAYEKSCPQGERGSITATCQKDLTWSSETNTCAVPIQCEYDGRLYDAGTRYTESCLVGQSGTISGLCGSDSQWADVENNCSTTESLQCEYQGRGYNPGQRYTESCPAGKYGSISATCDTQGLWINVINSCSTSQANACSYEGRSYNPGQRYTSSCPAGQSGSISGLCDASGGWINVSNNCAAATGNEVQCDYDGRKYSSGQQYTESCPSGQIGAISGTCNENGNWVDIDNQCSQVQSTTCSYSGREYNPGERYTSTCPSSQSGTLSGLCNSQGDWVNVINNCAKQCSYDGRQYIPGQQYKESCPSGQVGSVSGTCNNQGEWTNVISSCTAGNNTIFCSYEGRSFSPMQSYTLPCPSGQTGTISGTCSATGQWENVNNQCNQAVQCEYNGQMYHPDQTYTESCPAGHSGSISGTCNNDGTWKNVINRCTLNQCEYNGTFYNPGNRYTVSCQMYQVGSISGTCDLSGTWKDVNDTCRAAQCEYDGRMFNAGSRYTVSCSTGGSISGFCKEDGAWSDVQNNCL